MNQIKKRFREWVIHQPAMGAGLATAVVIGLMDVFFAMSFASLFFRGPLTSFLPLGAGLMVLSTAIAMIVIALFSSQPGVFSAIQDVPAVLFSVIVRELMMVAQPGRLIFTVLVAMALSTLFTGLLLLVVGQLRLGGLVRYVPYPVIGGFLAATGWLLVAGSFGTMAGYDLTIANLPRLLQPAQLQLWVPGLVIAVAILLATRLWHHSMVLPLTLGMIMVCFFLFFPLTGISIDQATRMGFFYEKISQISWQPLYLTASTSVDWTALLGQAGNIAVLMGMTLVGLMLNISATELVIAREFDLNQELRTTGIVNLLAGLCGGVVGYHALGTTSMVNRSGVRSRLAPLMAGLVILAVGFSGLPVLSIVPRPLVGGVLLSLGLDFLYDWVLMGRARFSWSEFGIVLLILIVIVTTDFLTGVTIGLLAMVLMFVISYSRTRVVQASYPCGSVQSLVMRSRDEVRVLTSEGQQGYIIELQGFLFFGTANALFDQVKQRLNDPNQMRLTYLQIDFRRVTGIDSSAALSFQKMGQKAHGAGITMLFTSASPDIQQRLHLTTQTTSDPSVKVFQNLDFGLEWMENQILARHPVSTADSAEFDVSVLPGFTTSDYFGKVEVLPGEHLMERGDPADCLYFILSGQVSIYSSQADFQIDRRVRTLGPGHIIGEIGMYLQQPRTALVIANQPTCLIRVSRAALERMEKQSPELAAAFHQMIVRNLSVRVLQDDRSLTALRK